jgi:hypothetical protein
MKKRLLILISIISILMISGVALFASISKSFDGISLDDDDWDL